MTEGTGASRGVVALAALFGLAAVAAGAFATHGLKQKGLVEAAGWVETASRYQMWHALAMLLTAVLLPGARVLSDPICSPFAPDTGRRAGDEGCGGTRISAGSTPHPVL